MADIHINIMVADQDVSTARTIAAALSPAGFSEFRIPLRPIGDTGPATHWLTSGWLGEQFVALARDPDALYAVTSGAGLPYTLDQLKAMHERAVIVPVEDQDAQSFIAAQGMEIAQEAET